MPQTTNYGFPLLAATPPEGMTGKDLRDLILGEGEDSLAQKLDAALKNVEDTIPSAQVQADWSQTDNTQLDYIKNKPCYYLGNRGSVTFGSGLDFISLILPADAMTCFCWDNSSAPSPNAL